MFNDDGTISEEFKAEASTLAVPTGAYMYFATLNNGDAWLLCDGREISRTTYTGLFSAIGTLFGAGDGSTTFNLPDGRDRSLISAGPTISISAKYVGENTHTMTVNELVAHSHVWQGPESRTEERGDGANVVWRGSDPSAETENTGGGQPFNVIHKCVIGYLHIKT